MNAHTAQEIRFVCQRFFGSEYPKSQYRRAKEVYSQQPRNEKSEVKAVQQVQREVTLARVADMTVNKRKWHRRGKA